MSTEAQLTLVWIFFTSLLGHIALGWFGSKLLRQLEQKRKK